MRWRIWKYFCSVFPSQHMSSGGIIMRITYRSMVGIAPESVGWMNDPHSSMKIAFPFSSASMIGTATSKNF